MKDSKQLEAITLKGFFYTGDIHNNYLGHIMAEIFKDKIYAKFIENKKDLVIMDIGAHVGIFSHYAAPFAKKIYAIEPSLEHFTTLVHMLAFNNFDHVEPHRFAIANKNGQANFWHSGNKTAHSLLNPTGAKNRSKETVDMVTLKKFMNDNEIEHVDFMKMDIEGSEFEVLGGSAFSDISDRVDSLVVESHDWSGRNPNQLVESLKNNGYKVYKLEADATLLAATRK